LCLVATLPPPPAPSSLLDPTETDLHALMTNLHLHTQLEDTPAKVQHGMASMMRHAAVAAPVLRRNVALAAIDLHRTAAERLAVAGLSSSSDLVPPKHRSALQVSVQTTQIAQAQLVMEWPTLSSDASCYSRVFLFDFLAFSQTATVGLERVNMELKQLERQECQYRVE
jgi:hypothetical protein